ncbi:reprolysin-like metallopeptidase [Urbifossiella limnaea]|uniref:Matrixin family metalloprotease n=1 Tax=Urbifossiella limnaea TaxID=2528023 RepID=A0A517Y0V7_9BACT|nr:matrix metalloproteinase-11 [Urbifossiella limnaea]QDU23395.1 hypothetical protein ETAA1_53950 [Urbifossiella limnaea]
MAKADDPKKKAKPTAPAAATAKPPANAKPKAPAAAKGPPAGPAFRPQVASAVAAAPPGVVVCSTEQRTDPNLPIVVGGEAPEVRLWVAGTVLRWRCRKASFVFFSEPKKAMDGVKKLVTKAMGAWGAAAPVKLAYDEDDWDFEVVMNPADNRVGGGYTLARAFFPGGAQRMLMLYPRLFSLPETGVVATLCHELGHVFGLRHFFAVEQEGGTAVPFGEHRPKTIMNYGPNSTLTAADKADLARLYKEARAGTLTKLGRWPVKLVKPSTAGG